MAYADLTSVQGMNAHRTPYSASTKPTREQVEAFIDEIAGEIDSALSAQGIASPVASPAAFVLALRRLNSYGAAALAEMAQFPEADRGQGSSAQGDRYWQMYKDGLKALRDGSGIPADAPTNSSGTLLTRSYGTDNLDEATGLPPASVFTMRKQF